MLIAKGSGHEIHVYDSSTHSRARRRATFRRYRGAN